MLPLELSPWGLTRLDVLRSQIERVKVSMPKKLSSCSLLSSNTPHVIVVFQK